MKWDVSFHLLHLPFFDEGGKGTWKGEELEILGRNIVRLAKAIKKAKLL